MNWKLLKMAPLALVVGAAGFGAVLTGQTLAGEGPGRGGAPGGPGAAAPVPVTAAIVEKKPMPVEVSTFGAVEANATVSIKPQVTGVITAVNFKDGQAVKKGDKLFSIDDSQFKAELNRAKAQFANAKSECQRQEDLDVAGGTTKSALEQARTNLEAAKAAMDLAALNFGYCSITSPIDGRAGARLVDAGNLVKSGDVALVVINQVQPIQVGFAVPQQNLAEIKARMAEGKLAVRAFIPGASKEEMGELVFVDNAVDRTTGTIRLKAEFANAAEKLWPGLFVTVKVILKVEPEAIVVPSRAVQNSQKGQSIYVLDGEATQEKPADVRIIEGVKVNWEVGDESIITCKDIKPGDRVVTDGQFRLTRNSKAYIIQEASKPGQARPEGTKNGPEKPEAKSGSKPGAKTDGATRP